MNLIKERTNKMLLLKFALMSANYQHRRYGMECNKIYIFNFQNEIFFTLIIQVQPINNKYKSALKDIL